MEKLISFTLNGIKVSTKVDVRKSLLELLRTNFHLTGTKEGCGVGECGACTVIVDGENINSCIFLAVWADGKTITTIEGIENSDGSLSDIQQNLVDSGAIQCGFCTPGIVMSATALLDKNPNPSTKEIKRGLSGNLCRCTGYKKIIDAVKTTVNQRNS